MRNFIKVISVFVLAALCVNPFYAFASEVDADEFKVVELSEEEFREIIALGTIIDNRNSRASDLISYAAISVSSRYTSLYVAMEIKCVSSVVKCGFKDIVIERRYTDLGTWSEYKTYDDMLVDANAYDAALEKLIGTGYQFRAKCTFYAKKNLLSVQKMTLYSNIAYT